MGQRVLIGVDSKADFQKITKELLSLGAEAATGPSAVQPDLIVATMASETNLDEFLTRARKLPGVRYAEPDAWRFTS